MSEHERLCPECQEPDGLWRGVLVKGWEAVSVSSTGRIEKNGQRDVEWAHVEPDGTYGCSCGWEGARGDLVTLGWDGEPLPKIHPRQERLDVAA